MATNGEEEEEFSLVGRPSTPINKPRFAMSKHKLLLLVAGICLLLIIAAVFTSASSPQAAKPKPKGLNVGDYDEIRLDDDVVEPYEPEVDDRDEEPYIPDSSSSAPRSMPELEYNEKLPKELYMVYNPSGGMTNQEMELESALHMAKLLNRTLYVPQIGRHTNLVSGYMKLSSGDLFPADRMLDFELMTTYARVIPLNVTVRILTEQMYSPLETLRVKTDVGFQGDVFAAKYANSQIKLVYFNGLGMWHRWWPLAVMHRVKRVVSPAPYMRVLSLRITEAFLGNEFYAIHGRLGDQTYRWQSKSSLDHFVNTPEFSSWNKSLNLYLASDEPDNKFFDPIKQRINVITLHDIRGKEMDEFRQVFGQNLRFRNDMLGLLDKLICIQSIGFMGSQFSTFSLDIKRSRGAIRYVFPELYAKRHPV